MHSSEAIENCKNLRKKGYTLGEIVKETGLPKTTVFYHIRDISLSSQQKEKIEKRKRRKINKHIKKNIKGKCRGSRNVDKPDGWTDNLLLITAHFMFDGEITRGCVYSNRNIVLINRVKNLTNKIFNLEPSSCDYRKKSGVHKVSYYYVELANYFKKKCNQVKKYIKDSSLQEKKIFLRAFFDDEGCVSYSKKWNSRKVRGYQKDKEMLLLIKELLQEFNIESRIDKGHTYEVVVSRKENLIKFRDKINFSEGVFINPDRKNSIWDKKLEKRKILNKMLASYVRI